MEKILRNTILSLALALTATMSFAQGYNNIHGQVLYNYSTPMEDVTAYLADSTGTIIDSTVTNPTGRYHFNNLTDGSYTISFATEIIPGGITLSDGYLVMEYLMNQASLTSFQKMLADVDNDDTITWADYDEIVYSYLNQGNPLSGGPWDFETTEVTVGGGGRQTVVTGGGSNGDVNGTFQPPKSGSCLISSNQVELVASNTSEKVLISLRSEQYLEFSGMHLVLSIPEGITVHDATSVLPGMKYTQTGGEIRITWMEEGNGSAYLLPSEQLLTLKVSSPYSTGTGNVFFTPQSESHFIGALGNVIPVVNLSMPGLAGSETQAFTFSQSVYPNPFLDYVTLDYDLPSESQVKVIVYNSAGQVMEILVDEMQEAGRQSNRIDGSQWPAGTYHYAIILNGEFSATRTGTMIKSK